MKRTMTRQEAGRLGGEKVKRKYGIEHFREIGRKGARAAHAAGKMESMTNATNRVTGDARDTVRRHPAPFLLASIGLGFIVGKALSR